MRLFHAIAISCLKIVIIHVLRVLPQPVRQDGCVEAKIPSVDLFPIHHMDELEFFPGSFVVDAAGRLCTIGVVFLSCLHFQLLWGKKVSLCNGERLSSISTCA